MRNVRNGDPDDMTARIFRIIIGVRKTGIVVVTRIMGINRDQRQLAQIFALAQIDWRCGVGFFHDRIRKMIGNTMLMDRNQANGFGRTRITQPRNHAGAGHTHASFGAGLFGLNQFSVLRAFAGTGGHVPFTVCTLVDRHDATGLGPRTVNAQNPLGVGANAADQPTDVFMRFVLHSLQPHKRLIAWPHRRVRGL